MNDGEKGALVMKGWEAACLAVHLSKGLSTNSPCRKWRKQRRRAISSCFCSCVSLFLLARGHFIITSSSLL